MVLAWAASTLAGKAQTEFGGVTGPIFTQAYADIRDQLGWNDIARARKFQARLNYETTNLVDGLPTANFAPVRLSVEQAIKAFNQCPWTLAEGNQDLERAFWGRLRTSFKYQGVRIEDEGLLGGAPGQAGPGIGLEWLRLVDMASTAAPLDSVLKDYWRSRTLDEGAGGVSDRELRYNLQRAEYRRKADRDRLLKPFASWSADQWVRLWWMGVVSFDELTPKLRSAGVHWDEDRRILEQLSARRPDPGELIEWAKRRLWSDEIARHFGLDDGFDESPLAKFFCERQGLGAPQPGLPDQPDGNADWLKLNWRAARSLPGFGEARELQFRLRPRPNGNGESVVPGIPAWTEQDTYHVLRVAGFPERVIGQLQAVVPMPINIRIVNHILTETLKHPALAAQAQQLMGEGVDWVQNAFLDHGFTAPIAKVTADAIRQAADDSANAERLELEKKQREETRALILRRYELGVITDDNATDALVGQFVTRDMALAMLLTVDEKIRTDFVATATAEIKAGFLEGKLSVEQAGGQLNVLGVNPTRQAYYIQEWVWQRNDRQRLLSTGEIIAALKQGLFSPEVALARLTNLGWTAPDALVEIALAEHEIQAAAAHAQQTAAAKAISDDQRKQREAAAAAKAKAAVEARAKRDADKLAKEEAAAPLQQDIAVNKYTATALVDLDAYNKAAKHKDQNKMDAEVDKAATAYKELLLAQLRLSQISEKVADESERVEPVAVPPVEASEGTSADASGAPSPASPAPTTDGGAESPPGA